jgi:hypothetical protein
VLPPEPQTWEFAAGLSGTRYDIEHIADDEPENPTPYWHVQQLTVSELRLGVARGTAPGWGVQFDVPIRVVRDRVHYLDLNRQPYTPPNPGLHHRNETLTGVSDPELTLHVGHQGTAWSVGGRFGLSVPLGRTEPNPFELGRQGLWHQHIQFGTGTWDGILHFAAARSLGPVGLDLNGAAKLTFYENTHGYRAGNRYAARAGISHVFGKAWSVDGGLLLSNEKAETWNGRIETEGNLGRTDLFLSIGGARFVGPKNRFYMNLEVPLHSHATGEQTEIPVIFAIGWGY